MSRSAEFHNELERAARAYKEKYQVSSEPPDTIAYDLRNMAINMEFQLLDKIVSELKTKEITEVSQKFVLKVLKQEITVSDDRFDNLTFLAKQIR